MAQDEADRSRISFAITRSNQASNHLDLQIGSSLLAPSSSPSIVPTDLRTNASKAPSSKRRQPALESTTLKAGEQQPSSYDNRVKEDDNDFRVNFSQYPRSLKRTHSPSPARTLPSEHCATLPAPNSPPSVQASGMTEPPAKRAKRTDSSAMWDRNSPRLHEEEERGSRGDGRTQRDRDDRRNRRDIEKDVRDNTRDRRDAPRREGRERDHGRDIERRQRSRSRERKERKRQRSRSRDREARYKDERRRERSRDGQRRRDGDGQDRRDHGRDRSKDKHRSRDEPPARRSERPRTHSRSRSRSPIRDRISGARTCSPLRPSKPNGAKSPMPDPEAKTTIPSIAPPIGPRSQKPATTASKVSSTTPTSSKPNDTPPTTGPSVSASKPLSSSAQSKAADVMDVDEDPETAEMRKMMGFAGFRTTKQTKVPGNNVYCVRKEKKTEYRQYMNRLGGFNRPLSPSR